MEDQSGFLEGLGVVSIKDIPRAKRVLEELLAERREISSQISSSGDSGSGTALDSAVADANDIVASVELIAAERDTISVEVQRCLDTASPVQAQLNALLSKTQPLVHCQHYLRWLHILSALSTRIASDHGAGDTASAVAALCDLRRLHQTAESSLTGATHLLSCMTQHIRHWSTILEAVLTKGFEETLKTLHWPFVAGSAQLPTIPSEVQATFLQQLQVMFKLQPFNVEEVSYDDVPYPLELMLQPLRKRFRYHFHGKRQTNDLKKPEWYLTQIRSWITVHSAFLKRYVQPLFTECCGSGVQVERLFVRSMIKLLIAKLRKDTPQLLAEPALLSHTIDELLSFASDLSSLTPTTATERQPLLEILEEKSLLRAWLAVEEISINDHLEKSLASPSAWQSHYGEVEDIDDTRAPECAELIMTYVQAVTDRYKHLPSLDARLFFCRLQLQAIERFTLHVVRVMEQELGDCTGARFASLLCTVHYLVTVLAEWAEKPFFLSLEERLQEESQEELARSSVASLPSPAESRLPSSTSSMPVTSFLTSRFSSLSLSPTVDRPSSLFAPLIGKLNSIKQKMMENVVEAILSDFRSVSKSFVQQKWVSFPSPQDVVVQEVSDAACNLLVSLRHHLRLAEKRLPTSLFTPVWINLARQLDRFVFDKIVMSVTLNEGGAAQLNFDLMRNFVPLFSVCTARPERYFPLVREACYLLVLRPGSAALLRDELISAGKENASMAQLDGSATLAVESELKHLQVKNIDAQQVLAVLLRRVDWPQTS